MVQGCTGCGQGASFPVGSVSGRVTSLVDGTALGGVAVSVALKAPVLTDSNGYYEIRDLPAGNTYRVRFALQGYVGRFGDGTLGAAAGDYPQGNAVAEVNTALSPDTAGITGRVYLSGGQPASQATVGVDMRGALFDVVRQVQTDANGDFTIMGLPGSPNGISITVVVQPFDEDADGRADYGVVQVTGSSFPGVTTRVDVDLRAAASSIVLLSSNMDDGTHAVDGAGSDALKEIFNRALVKDSIQITLTDIDQGRTLGTGFTLDSTNTALTVTPAGGRLTVGTNYRLSVFARAENTASGTFNRTFREVSATSGLGSVTGLTVTPTTVDWRTTSFTARWNPLAGAATYRVFGKDTGSNSAYVLLATVGNTPSPVATFSLPTVFDWFTGDAFQTPFANGVGLDVVVIPVDIIGNAVDPSTATAVRRTDNTAPRISSVVQTGAADNTSGSTPVTVTLTVQFNEYMTFPGPAPTITLPAGVTATYASDSNLTQGMFTLTVPAGVNGTGAFTINGPTDSSGNPMSQFDGSIRTQSQIAADNGFEAGSLASWNPTTTSTAALPAAVTTPVNSGTYAARLGNNTASIQFGQSQITQLMNVPAASTQVTVSIRYYTYTNFATAGHDSANCALFTGAGTLIGNIFTDYLNYAAYQSVTQTFGVAGGSQIRLTCYSYQDGSHVSGLYLDDIQVLAN
ncbi:MAG TPA: carboxypeptidase regulatory-like domain-containing protein [Myxococcaceae bacterium]